MLSLLADQHQRDREENAFSVADNSLSREEFVQKLKQSCQYLMSARPTAINLANAFSELAVHVQQQCKLADIGVVELKMKY